MFEKLKLTNLVRSKFIKSTVVNFREMDINKSIGQVIRESREQKELLLREVAASLEIDPSLLSKIELGDKRPTKEQIIHLAQILDVDEKELLITYLSDRLVYEIRDEELATEAIKVAEQKIEYLKKSNQIV